MGCLWPKISKISRGQKPQILNGWIMHVPNAHWRVRLLMMLLEVAWAVRVKEEVAFLAMRTCSFHVPAPFFSSFWKSPSCSFHPKLGRRASTKRRAGKRVPEKALPPLSLSVSLSLYFSHGGVATCPNSSSHTFLLISIFNGKYQALFCWGLCVYFFLYLEISAYTVWVCM